MLSRLAIQDIVLIDRLMLDFGTNGTGLIVFTGETGAGKSILLDALGLALGARSDAGLVRHGRDEAVVTAEFVISPGLGVSTFLEEHGLTTEGGVILRRNLHKDGRSRASINDQPCSVGLLRQCGQKLVEVHGQFESYGLLDAATHRGLLDAFAGCQKLARQVQSDFIAWQEAQQVETAARQAMAQAKLDEAYLRTALKELEDLAPQAGEAEQLAQQRGRLQQREKILGGLGQAQELLTDHRGAIKLVNEAAHTVAKITPMTPAIENLLTTLDRLAAELSEAESTIDGLLRDDALDPAQLNSTEERLFALRAAARKHQTTVDALPEVQTQLSSKLQALDMQDEQLCQLSRTTAARRQGFVQVCQQLSTARAAAAAALAEAVNMELPALKLGQAKLQVQLTALPEAEWGAQGAERVAFLGQTNPGMPAGPLQKIASGGELARFMLALKVALAAADPVPVLVFDEVDAGIGGATAAAVGERLARLALETQVLVVTHSPQVAARATQHWRVAKRSDGGKTTTCIEPLDAPSRQEEIARMLAGSAVTAAARQAAADLIAESQVSVKSQRRKKA